MSLFREIEKRIDGQLRKMFASESATAQGRELIEIQRAILDELEDRAQLLPRARRRFPYNDLIVRIAAAEPDRRSAIALVFIEGDALQNEIATYLRGEDIEVPSDLHVKVEALEDPPARDSRQRLPHYLQHARAAQRGIEAESNGTVHCPSRLRGTSFLRNRKEPYSTRPSIRSPR